MAENNDFLLRVITPERVFYEGKVEMVEFNTTEGEIGVLPGHVPTIAVIKPGILTIYEAEKKLAALHSGFCEILPDKVTILAEVVEWPSEIDRKRAEEAMKRAEGRIKDRTEQTDIVRAQTALLRAIVRIEALK